ncbi:hypothetical protein AN1V17_32050 [Vallitalea sediminicola]
MGQTKYNLNTLSEKENDIIVRTKRIDYIFNRFKVIRNSIDIDITRRDNIDDKFDDLTNDFQNIIESTYNSSQVINKAVIEYSNSEHQIQNLLNQLLDTSTDSHDTDMTKTDHDEVSISGVSILQNWFERLYNQLISKITHVKKFFEDNGVHINNKDYSEYSVGQIKESADLQDADILSSSDLNNVIGLKSIYANYATQDNKEDEMFAILRAIEAIRQKDQYNGLYDSKDKYGTYVSVYQYQNKEIKSKIEIVQNDLYIQKTGFNILMTGFGYLAPPYNVIAALSGIAPQSGKSILNEDLDFPNATTIGLTIVGFDKTWKGSFFNSINGIMTQHDLKNAKGQTGISISVTNNGYIENFKFTMDSNHNLLDARKEKAVKISIPAQFSYLNEKHPSPDLWLKNERIKIWFENQ